MGEKKCTACGVVKVDQQFDRDKGSQDGLASVCLDCAPPSGGWRRPEMYPEDFYDATEYAIGEGFHDDCGDR